MASGFVNCKPHLRVEVFQNGAIRAVEDIRIQAGEKRWAVSSAQYGLSFCLDWELRENRLDVRFKSSGICESAAKIATVAVLPELYAAACGQEGYLALPVQLGVRCDFTEKAPDRIRIPIYNGSCREGTMACFGILRAEGCLTGILTAGECDASLEVDVCYGEAKRYGVAPVFHIREHEDDEVSNEEYALRYLYDSGSGHGYGQVARRYREYQMAEKGVRPLKARMAERPALAYAAGAMHIRIRQAWKPAPGRVDQTPGNEPPVRAAMPFDRVGRLLEQMKKAGLAQAEICLVGWNAKGHDGRYPQILPVEETLGGEAALKALTAQAKALGYQITCHDNFFDAYPISQDWDENDIIRDHEGRLMQGGVWSGGQSHWVCGKVAVEKYLARNISAEKALGFAGVHYSDVLTILGPNRCYHPAHPTSRAQSASLRRDMLRYFQQEMGGSSSESLLDFAAPALDRALYVEFDREQLEKRAYVDAIIPLLPMVYHGVILYNISTESVNSILKDRDVQLRCAEYGSIPQAYLYSAFMTDRKANWMGGVDLTAEDEEDMGRSVEWLKRQWDMFAQVTRLQGEMIRDHRQLARQVFVTTYENGSAVIVNYGQEPFSYENRRVEGKAFVVMDHQDEKAGG